MSDGRKAKECPKCGTEDIQRFQVHTTTVSQNIHRIYLSETIENNFDYVELFDLLKTAPADDEVILYLANYGGHCSTGFQLFNTIRQCQAQVDIIVDAPCYSMGAILALAGDSLEMKPGSFLMFHNYSSMNFGKGSEMSLGVAFYHKHFHGHLDKICFPFLSKQELNLLKNDSDIYINDVGDAYIMKDGDLKIIKEKLEKRIRRHFNVK